MSMLKSLWGRRRVKHLEACNLDLARHADHLQCERDDALAECRNARESWAQTIADMNKVIAERESLKGRLAEAESTLANTCRERDVAEHKLDWARHHLDGALVDLNAAEALLDEAAEQINDLNAFVDALIDDRNDALDKLDDIARVIRR